MSPIRKPARSAEAGSSVSNWPITRRRRALAARDIQSAAGATEETSAAVALPATKWPPTKFASGSTRPQTRKRSPQAMGSGPGNRTMRFVPRAVRAINHEPPNRPSLESVRARSSSPCSRTGVGAKTRSCSLPKATWAETNPTRTPRPSATRGRRFRLINTAVGKATSQPHRP